MLIEISIYRILYLSFLLLYLVLVYLAKVYITFFEQTLLKL